VENALEGRKHGIRIFDSSVGGLGGCPYAPGAGGNVATEALLDAFESEGHGVDRAALAAARAALGRGGRS
jgi:hydroxymethylglutaryl-CoA lyase